MSWERARRRFSLKGDDVYDDDDADKWAEEQMLAEALGHWRTTESERARVKRYRWWNQLRLRDLDTERQLALYAVREALAAEDTAARGRRTRRTIGTRQRRTRSAKSRRRT